MAIRICVLGLLAFTMTGLALGTLTTMAESEEVVVAPPRRAGGGNFQIWVMDCSNPTIDYSPTDPQPGDTVRFEGRATLTEPYSGSITYTWAFGDNSQGQGQVINHVYNSPYSYTVWLTITADFCGPLVTTTVVKVGNGTPGYVVYLPVILKNE